jgi:hypothetical protein
VLYHTSGRAVFRFRRMATGPAEAKAFFKETGLRHAETGAEPPDSNHGVGLLLNVGCSLQVGMLVSRPQYSMRADRAYSRSNLVRTYKGLPYLPYRQQNNIASDQRNQSSFHAAIRRRTPRASNRIPNFRNDQRWISNVCTLSRVVIEEMQVLKISRENGRNLFGAKD